MADTVKIGSVVLGQGMPKICVPLVGANQLVLVHEAALARSSPAHLAEWRADCFDLITDLHVVEAALASLRQALGTMPLLFTFRTAGEGGSRFVTEEQYALLCRRALQSGLLHAIDLEAETFPAVLPSLIAESKAAGVTVVLSRHHCSHTPPLAQMLQSFARMQALGAHLPKLAVSPQCAEDVLSLLQAVHGYTAAGSPAIAIAMGPLGAISRVAGEVFGSCLTFASLEHASAPGQLSVKDTHKILTLLHKAQQGE